MSPELKTMKARPRHRADRRLPQARSDERQAAAAEGDRGQGAPHGGRAEGRHRQDEPDGDVHEIGQEGGAEEVRRPEAAAATRILKKETTEKEPAGYVRMRLQVRDGEVTVLDAKAVEGPLVETKLQGALAYEATLGTRRVAAGAIPDVGEKRSFPAPKAKGAQATHFVTPLESYEINVRVPKEEVTLESAAAARGRALPGQGGAPAWHTPRCSPPLRSTCSSTRQVREVATAQGLPAREAQGRGRASCARRSSRGCGKALAAALRRGRYAARLSTSTR